MYLVKKKGSLELPMAMKKGSHVVPLDKRSRHHISFKPVFSYNAKKKQFYVNMKLLLKTAKSREEKNQSFLVIFFSRSYLFPCR